MDVSPDKPHILVVDDDTRLRELLKTFLSRNGFRVTAASHAAEARQRLAALDFDLIVLDVMMPGETGLEFAGELRRTDDVPILMLTAMGESKDRIAGLEKGVDDYLAKPFEVRELLLRIQSVLRRNRPAAEAGAEPIQARPRVGVGVPGRDDRDRLGGKGLVVDHTLSYVAAWTNVHRRPRRRACERRGAGPSGRWRCPRDDRAPTGESSRFASGEDGPGGTAGCVPPVAPHEPSGEYLARYRFN